MRKSDVPTTDAYVVNFNCTDLCNCCDSEAICENSCSPNDDLEEDEDVALDGTAVFHL